MKSTTAGSGAPTNPVGPTLTSTTFTGRPACWSRSTRKSPVKWSTAMLPRPNDCSTRIWRTGGCASVAAGPSVRKTNSTAYRNRPPTRDSCRAKARGHIFPAMPLSSCTCSGQAKIGRPVVAGALGRIVQVGETMCNLGCDLPAGTELRCQVEFVLVAQAQKWKGRDSPPFPTVAIGAVACYFRFATAISRVMRRISHRRAVRRRA